MAQSAPTVLTSPCLSRRISPPRASHRPSSGICCFRRFSNGEEIDSNQQFPGGALLEDGHAFSAKERRAHLRWAEQTVTELNEIAGKQRGRPGHSGRNDLQANDLLAAKNPHGRQGPLQIAPWCDLAAFLLIGIGMVAGGVVAQQTSTGSGHRKRCRSVNGPTWEPQSRN
jgi:hypothetical protein